MNAVPAPARSWQARPLARILARFAEEAPWMPPRAPADYRRELARLIGEGAITTLNGRCGILGFIAVRDGEIHALYVAPGARGQGVGKRLLDDAKTRAERLTLWTAQANDGARRFYAREGFVVDRFATGAGNEDGLPDMRMVWRREAVR